MKNWMPKDIIAVIVILIAGGLLFFGINGKVGWTLVAVVCGYYGIDFTPFFKIGRNQSKKEE